MRGITRAAAYRPHRVVAGHHVAAPDEDGFTLAASALERLEDASAVLGPPARLLLAGELPPDAGIDIVRFVGYPLPTQQFGTGARGLSEAWDAATATARAAEPVLVIAVDLPSRTARTGDAGGPPYDDAAVALRVEDQGEATPKLGQRPEEDGSATLPLLALGRERLTSEPDRWVGDFAAVGPATDAQPAPRTTRAPLSPDGPVSQGAYIPRPRYLESLPSRWRFTGEKCGACGAVAFPPRGRCHQCGATDGLEAVRLPRDDGEVVAVTTIRSGGQPTEFDEQVASEGQYTVVLVELLPGARVTLQVADARPGEVAVGSRVATRLRRLYPMEGEWRYGRKAVPSAGARRSGSPS